VLQLGAVVILAYSDSGRASRIKSLNGRNIRSTDV
jgi:hypothetical protein